MRLGDFFFAGFFLQAATARFLAAAVIFLLVLSFLTHAFALLGARTGAFAGLFAGAGGGPGAGAGAGTGAGAAGAVSYTHLTLPTTPYV